MTDKYSSVERKDGKILGIRVSITSKQQVLDFINSSLDSKEKFYIVTPNPENLLIAANDWELKKVIGRSDFSIPDGIGLKFAYKYLFGRDLEIIKGRELFLDIIKIADERKLRVYLFGGGAGESEKARIALEKTYKNVTFKTNHQFPEYDRHGEAIGEIGRNLHKSVIGSVKLFEPDLIFVAMNTPKQEKWIHKNFFRLPDVTGAMAVGGTFNYISGDMSMPPKWLTSLGLEWVFRFFQEPWRIKRIFNAVIVFPWRVFLWKLKIGRR